MRQEDTHTKGERESLFIIFFYAGKRRREWEEKGNMKHKRNAIKGAKVNFIKKKKFCFFNIKR